ncbi:MAG: hypothetical protein ACRC3Y_00410 [Romboutsia sp.]|uniref:hypothetical protein n=1 Tax=Romboutsia sp. TaxID=1965302 RepID=UPI003F2AF947
MKKSLIALSVVSLLGLGVFTTQVSASDQSDGTKVDTTIKNTQICINGNPQRKDRCASLTDEQKSLIEKGYNELTQEEKDLFDKYHRQSKKDLSEVELNKYYEVCDKVHKYMDEEFKIQVKEKREEKKSHKEEMKNNQGHGKGQGKRQGQKSCHQ